MTTLQAKIPDSLYQQLQTFVLKHSLSIDQFVTLALGEQIAKGYLEERAERGSWEKAVEVLQKVPDVEPEEYDRL
ncbi:hypothetical protein HYR99_07240 [Candidatus Poribacteria bacterium]|nr:hypothetical protein [Candidatus Poribacteria bacterium]